MSKVKIQGNASGSGVFTLTTPNTSTDRTITLPDGTGTLAFTTGDDDKLPLAGGTMTGTTVHGDNIKDTYGAGADLEIYHDGAHNRLQCPTGELKLRASAVRIGSVAGENGINMVGDGAVELYHNNAKKIETAATGVTVTGDIDMTGVLNGTAGSMDIKNEANGENIFIKTTSGGSEVVALKIHSGGTVELAAGQGLRVGGTADANTLDDYEEGFVNNGIANVGMPSGYTQNRYTKIGNVCTVTGQIRASSNGGGTYSVSVNLPFAAESNQTNARPFAAASLNCIGMNLDSGYIGWSGKVDPGASICQILQHKPGADSIPFRVNQIDTTAFQLTVSITYVTA